MDKVKYNPEFHKVVYNKTKDFFIFNIENRIKSGELNKNHTYKLCEERDIVFPKLREIIRDMIESESYPDYEITEFYDPEPEKLLVLEKLFEKHIKEFVKPYWEVTELEVDFSEINLC